MTDLDTSVAAANELPAPPIDPLIRSMQAREATGTFGVDIADSDAVDAAGSSRSGWGRAVGAAGAAATLAVLLSNATGSSATQSMNAASLRNVEATISLPTVQADSSDPNSKSTLESLGHGAGTLIKFVVVDAVPGVVRGAYQVDHGLRHGLGDTPNDNLGVTGAELVAGAYYGSKLFGRLKKLIS